MWGECCMEASACWSSSRLGRRGFGPGKGGGGGGSGMLEKGARGRHEQKRLHHVNLTENFYSFFHCGTKSKLNRRPLVDRRSLNEKKRKKEKRKKEKNPRVDCIASSRFNRRRRRCKLHHTRDGAARPRCFDFYYVEVNMVHVDRVVIKTASGPGGVAGPLRVDLAREPSIHTKIKP